MTRLAELGATFIRTVLAIGLFGCSAGPAIATFQDESPAVIRPETVRIWDAAQHNAFTDLIRHDGAFYCTFRESSAHVPRNHEQDGRIRVISSRDGIEWESFDLVAVEGIDLRDPKLSVTPRDELMLLMGGSHYESGKLLKRQPLVAFLESGNDRFSTPKPVVIDEKTRTATDWLWRVTWRGETGFGVVYQPGETEPWGLQLVSTTDGIHYQAVKTLELPYRPNESTVRFDSEGQMLIVVRNQDERGHLGSSRTPFTEWVWKEIPLRLGGPDLIQLPGGQWILGTRKYGANPTTILGQMSLDGNFTERVEFPSGGDTSYPGLLLVDDQLWVSYYSSHEGKSSIYLAKLDLDELTGETPNADRDTKNR